MALKGIVFNLLEEVIRGEQGEDVWDRLLEATELDGVYTSLGSYPQADLERLVAAASAMRGQPADAILRWFGAAAMPLLAARYPVFFQGHAYTQSFLLSLNDIIHPEVRKLYPGADVPQFLCQTLSRRELVMIYQSSRKLCALAEGFIAGAADHYGERVVQEQAECMNRGASRCVLHITFVPAVE